MDQDKGVQPGNLHKRSVSCAGERQNRTFTFDVKVFVTVRVTAPTETRAREVAALAVEHCEGVQCNAADFQSEIVCASADGEADLIEINGEAT